MNVDLRDRLNKMVSERLDDNHRIKNIMPVSDVWIRGFDKDKGEFWFHKAICLALVEYTCAKTGKFQYDDLVYLDRLDAQDGFDGPEIQHLEDIFFEYEMNPEDLKKAKKHPCHDK